MSKQLLVGRTDIAVRPMTEEEMESEGWDKRTPVLVFDDGTKLYASVDDEGNGPGALFGMHPNGATFQVFALSLYRRMVMTTEDELRERIYEMAAHYAYYYATEGQHGRLEFIMEDTWASIAREAQGMQGIQHILLSVGWVDWLPRLENDYAAS